MRRIWQHKILAYVLALALCVAGVFLKLEFPNLLGRDAPFLLAMFPIILSALVGGIGPGVMSVAVMSVLVAFYFLEPQQSFEVARVSARFQILVFALQGLILCWMVGRQRRASEQNSLLAQIVDTSDDAIFSKSLEGIVLTWNNGARRLYGYRPDEMIGKSITLIVPEERRHEVGDYIDMVRKGKAIDHQETVRVTREGRRISVSLTISPIRDRRGKVTGASVIARDITEQKRLYQELERTKANLELTVEERTRELVALNQELERSNRELQDFAYVASHDLQEPLRKIQSFANLLNQEKGFEANDDAKTYIERMLNAAGRMRILIDDLLAFSRVTTKARPFERVDLQQVAVDVISDLETRIQDLGAEVIAEHLPVVEADPVQMRQVLQNLIGNALKFHKPGTRPRVRVYAAGAVNGGNGAKNHVGKSRRGVAVFCIEDNGIGLDEKYQDRIFTIFERLHTRQEYDGTGIGLAVVKKIIDRHKGAIRVRSKVGEGATFIISLPVKQG